MDVESSTSSTVGGTTPAARNVIAGNIFDQVNIGYQSSAVVQGNFLGVGASGSSRVGSPNTGVDVYGSGNTIGGTAHGAGNLISGNGTGITLEF